MPRRSLLLALLGLPFAALALPMGTPSTDGLFFGIDGPDGPVLQERLPFARPRLFSQDNENTRFTAWFSTARFSDDRRLFLRHGARIWPVGSRGGDDTAWSVSLEVDRDTAQRLAAWLEIPLQERTPLGGGLRGVWDHPGGTTIRVRITNHGDRPVGMIVGGRQRGPRDNQLSFEVLRDGELLPPLDGWDFGGPCGVRVLAPGETHEASADATKWADLSRPGRYEVRCRYEVSLVPGAEFPPWPDRAHETWEAAFTGSVGWVAG